MHDITSDCKESYGKSTLLDEIPFLLLFSCRIWISHCSKHFTLSRQKRPAQLIAEEKDVHEADNEKQRNDHEYEARSGRQDRQGEVRAKPKCRRRA